MGKFYNFCMNLKYNENGAKKKLRGLIKYEREYNKEFTYEFVENFINMKVEEVNGEADNRH